MIILLAIVCGLIAWTVTQEEIFREFREIACKRCWKKIGYLVTCYYCFSFWTCLGVFLLDPFTLMDRYVLAFGALWGTTLMLLNGFHLSRATLRGVRAWADHQESIKRFTEQTLKR